MADIYGFSPGLQELSDRAALTGELGVLGQIRNQAPSVPFIPRSPFPAPWGQAFDLGQFPGHSINPVQPWQSLQYRPNAGVVGQRPALAQPMGMQDMGNWQDPRGALAQVTPEDQPQQQPAPKPQQPNTGTQQPSMGTDPAAAAAAQAQHAQQSQDSDAWRWGLLAAGLGILANNSGHYGAAGPALGKGGMMGMQTYLGLKQNEKEEALKREHMAQTKAYQDKQLGLQERGVAVTEGKLANEVAKLKQQQEIALALAGDDPQMMRIAMAEPEKFIEFQLARRKPDYKEREIRNGEQARQEFSLDGGQNWSPVPGGGVYNMRAARGGTNVSVSTVEAPFLKKVAEGEGDLFIKQKGVAESAVTQLQQLGEAKKLLAGGMYTGMGAEYKLAAGKALRAAGLDYAADDVANTEAFAATMGRQTLELVKGLGAGSGISNADREYADKIAGGKINLDQKSIERIIDINERAARAAIHNYNQKAEGFASKPESSGIPYDMRVKDPTGGPVRRYNPATGKIE